VRRDGRGTWSDAVELELAFLGLNHRRRTGSRRSPTWEREVGGAMVLRRPRGCGRESEERIETGGTLGWVKLNGRGGGPRHGPGLGTLLVLALVGKAVQGGAA
jgi:hypothetical protein